MRHSPVTMRDWLASLPDEDLRSVVEVVPALRRASHGSADLRARIRELTDQQVEGLARAFLAGVAQRLRTEGFSQEEIDAPGPEDLRAMLLDHLPTAHGRLALHALLIGDGPASSTARTHAGRLLTALDEELPITTTHPSPTHPSPGQATTWSDFHELHDRLRHETTTLPPALRAAADAVAAGTLPVGGHDPALPPTAAALAHFAAEMAELATQLEALLGAEPVPADLDGVQVHLDRVAEEERVAAERALVREHREGISATLAKLEAVGGPAFLVESYRSMLETIDRELDAEPSAVPTSAVTLPQSATEARELLAGIGVDDGLLAVLRPWPELCDAGEFIPRDDVSAVVAAEPSQVPELLARLDRLGVLRENDRGELALDEVTLRCLTLLPVDESVAAGR